MLYYDDECCILQGRHCTCAIHWERSQFMTARSASPHGQKAAALTRHSSGDRSCVQCALPKAKRGLTHLWHILTADFRLLLCAVAPQITGEIFFKDRKGRTSDAQGTQFTSFTQNCYLKLEPCKQSTIFMLKMRLAARKQRYVGTRSNSKTKINATSISTVSRNEIISLTVHEKRD